MAENNNNNNGNLLIGLTIATPLALIIIAVAFFSAYYIVSRHDVPKPVSEEMAYIDAEEVYRSNENYNIAKKEIAAYTQRINSELQKAIQREPDPKKCEELRYKAKNEIALYRETLLQDIDKDVDDAINSVAESKNLKRIYVEGVDKRGKKNITNAVITEMHETATDRLIGLFGQKKHKQEIGQPKYERQLNFDGYNMAKVPEQGLTEEASGSLAMKKKKGSIVADTQLQPKTGNNKIAKIGKYALSSCIAYIQARNAALTELQMSAPKPAEKTCVSAKTVTKQPKTGIKPTDTIASRPSEITAAQIAALLNAASDKTYAAVAKFQEYTPIVIENTQGAMAMLSVKCGKMWQKIYPFAAAAKTQPVQIYRSVIDATTENIAIAQQPVTQETAKEEKAVEAATPVQQTADKPTDIKQTQPEQPKAEKAEQKPEKQSETEPVKTAENTAGKAASNVVSKPVTIQVAACLNKSGADDAVKKLRRKHIPARVDGIVKDGRQWWCVRITAVGSAQVNSYKQQLAAMGYIGVLVR